MKPLFLLLSLLLACPLSWAQPDLHTCTWPAKWISVPETGTLDYGVYYFRKDVNLSAVPVVNRFKKLSGE